MEYTKRLIHVGYHYLDIPRTHSTVTSDSHVSSPVVGSVQKAQFHSCTPSGPRDACLSKPHSQSTDFENKQPVYSFMMEGAIAGDLDVSF